jgi:hypothetical protein
MFRAWILVLSVFLASPAFGQGEQALREAFEGTTVRVKIDMPATSTGIDIRPEQKPPIDFARLGDLMKREGISVHAGQSILVTKVKATRNLIEFQLGGGGYGTFGDMLNSSSESDVSTRGKTSRERHLEEQIRAEQNPAKKRVLERDLRDERERREADNARAHAHANQANQLRESNIRQQRLTAGSRFNLRFANAVPAELLTPEGLRRALAPWVDFGDEVPTLATTRAATHAAGAHSLRKGLTVSEVERLLGPAASASEKREGSLVIQERTYHRGDETIVTRFVDDVLVRYSITSD